MLKRKFSKILGVGLTLALLFSLLLTGAPVAADVSTPTVTLDKSVVSVAAEYTLVFHVNEGLSVDSSSITVTFPDDTTVKETGWVDGDITLKVGVGADTDVPAVDVSVADVTTPITGRAVSFIIPVVVPADSTATVIFTAGADLKNPSTADTYQLYVCTDAEAVDVISDDYSITAAPGPVDVYNANDSMVYQESYDTITAALGHGGIGAGWTVKVHADTASGGNYDSSLETYPIGIHVVGVIVESVGGAASTTIDASAATLARAAVQIWDSGVTLGGDGVGFTIIASAATTESYELYGVEVFKDGAASDITIEGNTIQGSTGSGSPQVGIHIWGQGPYTNLIIKDNILTTTFVIDPTITKRSFGIATGANLTSLQGTFDGNNITACSIGMRLKKLETPTTAIFGNMVQNCDLDGIAVEGTVAIDVYSNTISGCGGDGLAISGVQTDIDVYKNTIHGNGNGVKVYDGVAAASVAINYNDIYDNTNTTLPEGAADAWTLSYENCGVFNADVTNNTNLDAKYNFWSDPSATPLDISGPDSSGATGEWPGTALGTGDIAGAVTGSTVIYNPWLTVPYEMVVDEGIRYYGSDTLTLQAGWNTLSVPLTLYDYADTIAEIEAMGDFLTTENYSVTYRYDPVEGWLEATTLVPCQGYYIKMNTASRFPVLYSNSLGLPALELAAGWNLIGSAFGIDKLDEPTWAVAIDIPGGGSGADAEGSMLVSAALDAIGAQASVVVSPSCPGQLEKPWAEIWSDSTTNHMYTGEGYWVFMTDTGTLAGFEITPFYFTAP